jgi:S-adenosylmethionine decarboxylase
METVQFGYHMTIDLYGCKVEQLSSMEECYSLLENLVKELEMTNLIAPYLVRSNGNEDRGGKDPGGVTGYVIIAESHISVHTFTRRKFASMDLYSCKPFDYDKALAYVKKHFGTEDVEVHRLDRGTRYPTENLI